MPREDKAIRRKAPVKESTYQRRLMTKLKQIPNSKFFVKEAKSIRGLPDIIGCVNGKFVALEVKVSGKELGQRNGRHILQRHTLQSFEAVGGFCSFIYPDNEEDILDLLRKL